MGAPTRVQSFASFIHVARWIISWIVPSRRPIHSKQKQTRMHAHTHTQWMQYDPHVPPPLLLTIVALACYTSEDSPQVHRNSNTPRSQTIPRLSHDKGDGCSEPTAARRSHSEWSVRPEISGSIILLSISSFFSKQWAPFLPMKV